MRDKNVSQNLPKELKKIAKNCIALIFFFFCKLFVQILAMVLFSVFNFEDPLPD
jgi:hypothetical protein